MLLHWYGYTSTTFQSSTCLRSTALRTLHGLVVSACLVGWLAAFSLVYPMLALAELPATCDLLLLLPLSHIAVHSHGLISPPRQVQHSRSLRRLIIDPRLVQLTLRSTLPSSSRVSVIVCRARTSLPARCAFRAFRQRACPRPSSLPLNPS